MKSCINCVGTKYKGILSTGINLITLIEKLQINMPFFSLIY
jgi:hypothetical protein